MPPPSPVMRFDEDTLRELLRCIEEKRIFLLGRAVQGERIIREINLMLAEAESFRSGKVLTNTKNDNSST